MAMPQLGELSTAVTLGCCPPLSPATCPCARVLCLQVVVASKFDNRLKEFAERWELDRYLSATGYLPPNVKPFFVALPKVGPTMHG